MIKKKKKKEFSKVMLVTVFAVTMAVTIFSCLMAWVTSDTTVFAYLIPAVFAELATATGFYYSKAKAENEIKLQKILEKDNSNDRSNTRI